MSSINATGPTGPIGASLGQVPDATSDGAPPEAIAGSERRVSPDSEFAQSSTEEAAEELQSAQQAPVMWTRRKPDSRND